MARTSTAAVAATETTAWSSGGKVVASLPQISPFPAERDSARKVRTGTRSPPLCLRTDDARSWWACSAASWAASRGLVYVSLMHTTIHRTRVSDSRLSTTSVTT